MGVKKIARPINRAKNQFLKWLKSKGAECVSEFDGEGSEEWDYYRQVDGFVGDTLYIVYFSIWNGRVSIDYSDEENRYNGMSVEEFLELIPELKNLE